MFAPSFFDTWKLFGSFDSFWKDYSIEKIDAYLFDKEA